MARRRRVGRPRGSSQETKPVLVKVGRTGGIVQEVCLNGDHTVEAALEAAGMEYNDSDKVRVNGSKASGSSKLKNHDIVTVSGKIEGGVK